MEKDSNKPKKNLSELIDLPLFEEEIKLFEAADEQRKKQDMDFLSSLVKLSIESYNKRGIKLRDDTYDEVMKYIDKRWND